MAWQAKRVLDRPTRRNAGVGLRAPKVVGAGAAVQFRIDPAEIRKVEAAMLKLPVEVRRKVAAKSIRRWGKSVIAFVKSNLPARTGRLRRDVVQRVRSYRKVVWSSVGGRVTKASSFRGEAGAFKLANRKHELGKDYLGSGWRMHFVERGFHPRGGPKLVRGRGVLRRASAIASFSFASAVQADVDDAIRSVRL